MNVPDIVGAIESVGVAFELDGQKVRVRYPDDERRSELAEQIAVLRQRRDEVAAYLKERGNIPPMPSGVRLVRWILKEPPIAIETCAVVTDPGLFARATLAQLQASLANPKRRVGWSVPQLIERLAQVGVAVVLEIDKSSGHGS
jgi:hypothetical protein